MTTGDFDEMRADINVTPLVDVVLVLLVILLLVAPMLKEEVPVELPIAAHARDDETVATPTLTVAADGAVSLDGAPLPSDDLATRLRPIFDRARTRRSCSPPWARCPTPASSR